MQSREAELVAQVDIYEHEITRIREKLPRLRSELASSRASLAQVRKAIRAYTGERSGLPSPQAKGGHARAQSMTPEERTTQARKAAKARWAKSRPGMEDTSR